MSKLIFKGMFKIKQLRRGSLIKEFEVKNGVVNIGLNNILDVMFHGGLQTGIWYVGLVDASGFTAFSNTDTMSSHAGWTEFQSYDEANRVEWTEGAASGQQITNATPIDFTISASGTVKGIFLANDNTKGGTSGTLWSTGAFTADLAVEDDDLIKITYTITAANA